MSQRNNCIILTLNVSSKYSMLYIYFLYESIWQYVLTAARLTRRLAMSIVGAELSRDIQGIFIQITQNCLLKLFGL